MNILLVLLSMCLVCGGVGLFFGARTCVEVQQLDEQKRLRLLLTFATFACLVLACLPLGAQEVVHAQSGKVVEVDAARKTLTLKLADGSKVSYQDISSHEPALSLDKVVREKTVPAGTYGKVGNNAVVLFFGYEPPTAVAIKELGSETPKESTGSVANFDRHEHSLTVKTDAAGPQTLVLTEDTIFDTSNGVVKLADYKPSKGDRVRCVTSPDSKTALFVAPL
jgi:hypothetical protein